MNKAVLLFCPGSGLASAGLNDSEGSGLDTWQFHGMAWWSSLAQVPNMEKQRYEKQHQAVDIPSLSGLPDCRTLLWACVFFFLGGRDEWICHSR